MIYERLKPMLFLRYIVLPYVLGICLVAIIACTLATLVGCGDNARPEDPLGDAGLPACTSLCKGYETVWDEDFQAFHCDWPQEIVWCLDPEESPLDGAR